MRVIIAGSRTIFDYNQVKSFIQSLNLNIKQIISGSCKGVDLLGERFAEENNIEKVVFKPEWGKYGDKAGPIRNEKMAQYADALILIWDGKSKGSKNMKKLSQYYELLIFEKII